MRGASKKLITAATLLARGHLRIPHSGDTAPEEAVTEALAAVGLFPAESLDLEETFYLWPECEQAFQLYLSLQTQWRRDYQGRLSGLRYEAVESYMNMSGIPAEQRMALMRDIQAMEYATLSEIGSSR